MSNGTVLSKVNLACVCEMKKKRISTAEHNEELDQKLEAFKRRLATKPVRQNTKKAIIKTHVNVRVTEKKIPEKCKIEVPEPQIVQKNINLEKLSWLEDRARENVRQWGVRAKIDVDTIKMLVTVGNRLGHRSEQKRKPLKDLRSNHSTEHCIQIIP